MMREIIPSSRWITVLLLAGLLALIVYGAVKGDPAAIVIVFALLVFFAAPAALLFIMNRRARRAPHRDNYDTHLEDNGEDIDARIGE